MAIDPFDPGSEPVDLPSLVLRLSMARGLDEVMAVVRRGVRRLLGADGATVVLREGEFCHYADEDAISPLWKGQRFPIDSCISGWVMRHGTPAVISDIYVDPRIPTDIYRLTFVRSLMMVPVGRSNASAAIGAYWREQRAFSNEEATLLAAIADATSVAMVNVSLYAELTTTAQQAMQKAKEAERANAAKDLFLAAASHNLRQPFQAMRLYQAVLSSQLTDPKAIATMANLDDAMKAGEALLKALLDMSLLDAGLLSSNSETFPVDDMLREIKGQYEGSAVAAGLRLATVSSAACVHTDRTLLRQMLGNLVENAIRFTRRGGVVIGCRRRAGAIHVEVWDSGVGIAEESQEAIFDVFYQLGNEARNTERGLGIGLSIVAKTCRLLAHDYGVRSHPGRGSLFWIAVPTGGDCFGQIRAASA